MSHRVRTAKVYVKEDLLQAKKHHLIHRGLTEEQFLEELQLLSALFCCAPLQSFFYTAKSPLQRVSGNHHTSSTQSPKRWLLLQRW
ncbi:hypothetical protein OESDEN_16878 [Oesophagostomum dentatum]|uniref:Uncharacterized protein n=1 Tax=Oesophagostomum dentatum TaxID=61180 RepID=A0A0B1SJL5_OESDE|nr:hypothetical protein OESDEN_16878 [Oesophagostomum dentatum]